MFYMPVNSFSGLIAGVTFEFLGSVTVFREEVRPAFHIQIPVYYLLRKMAYIVGLTREDR